MKNKINFLLKIIPFAITFLFLHSITFAQPTTFWLDNQNIPESQPIASSIGALISDDPTANMQYTIVAGMGSDQFHIDGERLMSSVVFDFESRDQWGVTINGFDLNTGTTVGPIEFPINIINVNESPVITNATFVVNINENPPVNTPVFTVTYTDPDNGDNPTLGFLDELPNDNGLFYIDGDQIKVQSTLNYETKSALSVKIKVTDMGMLFDSKEIQISLNDINEAPAINSPESLNLNEDFPVNTEVTTILFADPDIGNTVTLSFDNTITPNLNLKFQLNNDKLLLIDALNYETINSSNIYIKASDGELTYVKEIPLQINDANDLPVVTSSPQVQVNENVTNVTLYIFSTTDEDAGDMVTIEFSNNTTPNLNSLLELSGNELNIISPFNYEAGSNGIASFKISDLNGGNTYFNLEIAIQNQNDGPSDITLSNNTIYANQPAGELATINVVDEDQGDFHSYSLPVDPSTNNNRFSISGNKLYSSQSFAAGEQLTVKIKATDAGGLSFEKIFNFTAERLNHTPTNITLSNNQVVTGQQPGIVGTLSTTDQDTDETYSYTLILGNGSQDNGKFTIEGNQLINIEAFDFNIQSQFKIRIQTNDQNGGLFEKEFIIAVQNDTQFPVVNWDPSNPTKVALGSATFQIKYQITDNYSVDNESVFLWHKEISGNENSWQSLSPLANAQNIFTFSLPSADLSSLGIEYYAEATDKAGNKTISGKERIQIAFQDSNSPQLFGLQSGQGRVSDYQIISIPYRLNDFKVHSIFDEYNLIYDGIDWRLFHFDSQTQKLQEFANDFNELKQGYGYWVNTKHSTAVNIGAGETPAVSQNTPFEIVLTNGWNQIGNPYDFEILWQDILDYNGNPAELGNLQLFEDGSFVDGAILKRFAGGFVHWSGQENLPIKIPVKKLEQGGRFSSNENPNEYNLLVDLSLSNSVMKNNLGAFGINAHAKTGKDRFDQVTLPRFINFLEINFENTSEYQLTKNIIAPHEMATWSFVLQSNSLEPVFLKWSFKSDQNIQNSLLLINNSTGQIVDMRTIYEISAEPGSHWKIIYGPPEKITSILPQNTQVFIGEPYPNPFHSSISIQINPFENKLVKLVVRDIFNRIIREKEEILPTGVNLIQWDGLDRNGMLVKPGIYLLTIDIKSGDNTRQLVRRIIKRS